MNLFRTSLKFGVKDLTVTHHSHDRCSQGVVDKGFNVVNNQIKVETIGGVLASISDILHCNSSLLNT